MWILVILYIRMGLRIRDTSGIQRNLPRSSSPPPNPALAGPSVSGAATGSHVHHASFNLRQQSHVATPKRSVLRMLSKFVYLFVYIFVY